MNKSIAKKEFKANLVLERSITPTVEDLGRHKCTVELFQYSFTQYGIEWDIPSLEETEFIGIWIDDKSPDAKKVIDYDGVFELPKEIIDFLEEQGFDCQAVVVS